MRMILICLLWHGAMATGLAQSTSDEVSAEDKAAEVHRWADRVADEIQIRPVNASTFGKRVPGSLIRWSNPIADDVFGDCYLWTQDGKPSAFLSVYAFYDTVDNRRLTFQSLSEKPLLAQRNESTIWKPELPGIQWLQTVRLPEPGQTPVIRTRQLKIIANSCVAKISERNDPSSFRQLRLLAKPLYRYTAASESILDGAVFAFVDGTDPELLLLIECVGGDQPKIRIAPARQNHRRLLLYRNSNLIWEALQIAPPFPNPKISDPAGVYYNTAWQTIAAASD